MGGRGASSSGGGTGGISSGNIISTTSLISARERQQKEVDLTLSVLRDVQDRYGVNINDAQIATLDKKGASVIGYYDMSGNLAFNQNYFDAAKLDKAYDGCTSSGFHPSRGNKSGIEAVAAHEMGHRLTEEVGVKTGRGSWQLDAASNDIVKTAAKNAGYKSVKDFRAKISGYAKKNNAEAVAEAFSDVYCNGSKASRESQAVVNALNSYFGGK